MVGTGISGHDGGPLPALVTGQMRQEPVGGGVRIFVADTQVVADRLGPANSSTAALAWSAAAVSTAANPSDHSATVVAAGSSMGPVTLSLSAVRLQY